MPVRAASLPLRLDEVAATWNPRLHWSCGIMMESCESGDGSHPSHVLLRAEVVEPGLMSSRIPRRQSGNYFVAVLEGDQIKVSTKCVEPAGCPTG